MSGSIVPHPTQAREWQKRKEDWMRAIAKDHNVCPGGLRVAMFLRDKFHAVRHDVYWSQQAVARELGYGERKDGTIEDKTVSRGFRALVKGGYLIELKRVGRNGTKRYMIGSTGRSCPVDVSVDRTELSPSTGLNCPDRLDRIVLQTPEEHRKEPGRVHAGATSSMGLIDDSELPEAMMVSTAKVDLSVSQERAQRVVDRFFAHHRSKRTRSADWIAEWQIWISREQDFIEREIRRA